MTGNLDYLAAYWNEDRNDPKRLALLQDALTELGLPICLVTHVHDWMPTRLTLSIWQKVFVEPNTMSGERSVPGPRIDVCTTCGMLRLSNHLEVINAK